MIQLKAYNNPDKEKAVEVAEKERSDVDRMVLENDRSRGDIRNQNTTCCDKMPKHAKAIPSRRMKVDRG